MSDLIERSDVLNAIDKRIAELQKHPEFKRKNCDIDLYGVKKLIDEIPSVDQEQKKYKWAVFPVDDSRGRRTGHHLIQCPRCGFNKQIWHSSKMPKFCEACGADMRGENDE